MSSIPQPDDLTRKQRREAAREERRAAEQAAMAQQARRRRLGTLGGALAIAVVLLAVGIYASTRGGASHTTNIPASAAGSNVPFAKTVDAAFTGIPQHGLTLGNPNAPVTMVWFGDLQCPICRQFHADVLPTLLKDYVRTGKVKLVWRNLAFIGPDSTTAAGMAGAAEMQNKLWQFVSLFYYNQQEENSGYVTQKFLQQMASGAGMNVPKALTARFSQNAQNQLTNATQLANNTLPQIATPAFLIGKTGGKLNYFNYSSLTPGAFTGPINQLLPATGATNANG